MRTGQVNRVEIFPADSSMTTSISSWNRTAGKILCHLEPKLKRQKIRARAPAPLLFAPSPRSAEMIRWDEIQSKTLPLRTRFSGVGDLFQRWRSALEMKHLPEKDKKMSLSLYNLGTSYFASVCSNRRQICTRIPMKWTPRAKLFSFVDFVSFLGDFFLRLGGSAAQLRRWAAGTWLSFFSRQFQFLPPGHLPGPVLLRLKLRKLTFLLRGLSCLLV